MAVVIGCSRAEEPEPASGRAPEQGEVGRVRMDYGPILRDVGARSASFLFHAARANGTEVPWTAAIEIGPASGFDRGARRVVRVAVPVDGSTGFVAHVTVEGLEPQTRYTYVPLVDGRRALDGASDALPSFSTAPDLGGRNADFTAVFLADPHAADGPEAAPMPTYDVAARQRPLFWAQLGDVASGHVRRGAPEHGRTPEDLRALWARSFGDPASPQARMARHHPLNLATISDHELYNNFDLNWHRLSRPGAAATLHDRVRLYDLAMASWWNHFGWRPPPEDPLGRAALGDHGESVMAEPPVALLGDVSDARPCVANRDAGRFRAGDFVHLADAEGAPFLSRVSRVGAAGDCGGGAGTGVGLAEHPPRRFRADRGARLAVGASYASYGHYHAHRPFPFVEFLLLDTTSYRGDPYQERELDRDANRDTDHSRYPWSARGDRKFIFGDREHGGNRTTDGVRSWLGPTQKRAFLEALAGSSAEIVVVAAGYPLYSAKFEASRRYWEGRESGFDFATEVEEIVAALAALDKLVLWVHGDGHTPMAVRLRPNLYQLQVGPTLMQHRGTLGHRARKLASGDRSSGSILGGGVLMAGHQPDLNLGDDGNDVFLGHLDQFEGLLRLYFHPGREVLRSSELAGLRRGESDREVEIRAAKDPARAGAGRHVVGKVVRLRFGDRHAHSVVRSYAFEAGRVRLALEHPIVTADPDALRVLIDATPWVEATWIDSRGHEWRDFSFLLRRQPGREP